MGFQNLFIKCVRNYPHMGGVTSDTLLIKLANENVHIPTNKGFSDVF